MPDEASVAQHEISLLLEEYRALRAEVVARGSARVSLLAFFGTGAALVVGTGGFSVLALLVGCVLLASAVAYWLRTQTILRRLSTRLATLEGLINRRCASAYGSAPELALLAWETSFGPQRLDARLRGSGGTPRNDARP